MHGKVYGSCIPSRRQIVAMLSGDNFGAASRLDVRLPPLLQVNQRLEGAMKPSRKDYNFATTKRFP